MRRAVEADHDVSVGAERPELLGVSVVPAIPTALAAYRHVTITGGSGLAGRFEVTLYYNDADQLVAVELMLDSP